MRVLLFLVFAAGCPSAQGAATTSTSSSSGGPAMSSSASLEPPRVLYVTESAGFRHEVLPHSIEVLTSEAAGDYTLEHHADLETAIPRLSAARVLVFFTTGELTMDGAQQAAILAFVDGGGGFVGIHSATDTFYAWPEYGGLVGARFNGHPWNEEVGLKLVGTHPATTHFPSTFRITDEIYQFKEFVPADFTVILELDTAATDMTKGGIVTQPYGFPLSWVRNYGNGRVFYTALGHGAVWDDARFRTHVRNGILWAAGVP